MNFTQNTRQHLLNLAIKSCILKLILLNLLLYIGTYSILFQCRSWWIYTGTRLCIIYYLESNLEKGQKSWLTPFLLGLKTDYADLAYSYIGNPLIMIIMELITVMSHAGRKLGNPHCQSDFTTFSAVLVSNYQSH